MQLGKKDLKNRCNNFRIYQIFGKTHSSDDFYIKFRIISEYQSVIISRIQWIFRCSDGIMISIYQEIGTRATMHERDVMGKINCIEKDWTFLNTSNCVCIPSWFPRIERGQDWNFIYTLFIKTYPTIEWIAITNDKLLIANC